MSLPTEQSWHAQDAAAVVQTLGSGDSGLSEQVARQRLEEYGPNRLKPAKRHGPLVRFLLQFNNVLIYVLIGSAIITAFLQDWVDTGVIIAVVLVNAIIGFVQEGKAERALEAISGMLSQEATIIRDGQRRAIPAAEVVPGDVVVLRAGDKVPADLRLMDERELRIDEAILTGESVPAEKSTAKLGEKTGLGDRLNIAFSGTLVSSGQGTGVVVATGDRTEIGRISEMVSTTESITTPLIRQMNRFGNILSGVIVGMAVLVFVVGRFVQGRDMVEMFLAAVALAVAAIPEGLPAIMTIVLAIGVRRMAARHAIIRRLPAVDTLGALTVICTDKTGTLTRNEMTVTTIVLGDGGYEVTGAGYAPEGEIQHDSKAVEADDRLRELTRTGLLCNDSDVREVDGQWRPEGDPMESALITLAAKAGLDPHAEREAWPTLDTIPFESENRFMATLNRGPDGQRLVLIKGGPERLLDMCQKQASKDGTAALDKGFWEEKVHELASRGQRTLALAQRPARDGEEKLEFDAVQKDLTFLGLLGIIDPPRKDAIDAVRECHEAGIRVVMITGDHAVTARAIGRELNIGDGETARTGKDLDQLQGDELVRTATEVNVFARVSPEHKISLVRSIQSTGQVVAMTGDGVNDAPALKRADVGIAMGIKGTEVAKEAAEMVLTDDNFASIAHAVEEGRTVYDNLRKAILFLLPTNGGEGLTILIAVLAGMTLPLTPAQVLWVNMITSVTLGLALAFEPAEAGVMKRPPRDPKGQLINRYFLWRILFVSAVLCAGTFGMFSWYYQAGAPVEVARTVAVNTLVMFEAVYLINSRYILAPVLNKTGLFGSKYVLGAIAAVIVFQMVFTYVPLMNRLFGTAALEGREWVWIVLVALSVLFIVELEKWFVRKTRPDVVLS